jgi:hypothetical protein
LIAQNRGRARGFDRVLQQALAGGRHGDRRNRVILQLVAQLIAQLVGHPQLRLEDGDELVTSRQTARVRVRHDEGQSEGDAIAALDD